MTNTEDPNLIHDMNLFLADLSTWTSEHAWLGCTCASAATHERHYAELMSRKLCIVARCEAADPPAPRSSLSLDAVRAINAAGLSAVTFINYFYPAGTWMGDACGCANDRCAGFHHDAGSDCGCLPVYIDEVTDALAMGQ